MLLMPSRRLLFSQTYWSHRSVDCLPGTGFQLWLHNTGSAFNTFICSLTPEWRVPASVDI